jgi:hypothetical protein
MLLGFAALAYAGLRKTRPASDRLNRSIVI